MVEDSYPPRLRIPAPDELWLEFEKTFPYGPDDPYVTGLLVRARGQFVQVEIQAMLTGDGGLPDFFASLYDDFRGWDGERTWASLEGDLTVTATHSRNVALRWSLTHQLYGEPVWTFTVSTHHSPGEDLRRLAESFTELLSR
jgi:hypothetical protein